MRFVYAVGATQAEFEVRSVKPDACVADLAAALGLPDVPGLPGNGLWIDGRASSPELGLAEAGLVNGSVISHEGRRADGVGGGVGVGVGGVGGVPAPNQGPVVAVVRVVGGLETGGAFELRGRSATVGRDPACEVRIEHHEVSRVHCRIDVAPNGAVTIADLGSSNGLDVDGRRVLGTEPVPVGPNSVATLGGAVALRILPVRDVEPVAVMDPIREARAGGAMPFSRAPRPSPPHPGTVLVPPQAPARAGRATFGIATILGPVLMAGAMVVMTHNVMYAAISGLTPLMFVANFIEERTRGKRSMRRGVRAFTEELERFTAQLGELRGAEAARRRADLPDLAELLHRAEGPTRTLWERRPGASGFLQAAAGLGAAVRWDPPIDAASLRSEPAPEVAAAIGAAAGLAQVPVPVDLAAGGVVGIEGDRDAARACARALLCQAVIGAGPADVRVAIFVDDERAALWEWAKWLPHLIDHGGPGPLRVAVGAQECEVLAKNLLTQQAQQAQQAQQVQHAGQNQSGAQQGPVLLMVVDGAVLLEGRPCLTRELLSGRGGPVSGIVLTDRLPALCTATLTVSADGNAELRRVADPETGGVGLLATGVSERTARRAARALSRFEDPELRVEGAALPDSVTLLPLLGLPETSGTALLERWREGSASLRARGVIGLTEDGVFTVDLDEDGPHGLIAGTTGSGKSELLRTLIAGLAAGNDPEHLTFALVDYKGGGALDECARLPHSVGLVTDLDEQLGERALRCLEAELHHRERLLRDAGVSHLREYQALRDGGRRELAPMPRLAVVIDEFATLVKALPNFVDSLVSIAQLGRSLGIHLVMATQRPAGSVSDAIKNNVKLRIALRLESAGDSIDVIDSPVAAAIGGRQRGRAYYRVSAREVLPVQTALSTGVTAGEDGAAVVLAPFTLRRGPAPAAGGGEAGGPSDLRRLVRAAQDAAGLGGFAPPRRPWPEPLPGVVEPGALAAEPVRALLGAGAGPGGGCTFAPLALADDPRAQTQYPVGWDPGAGNLLIYGAPGYGSTGALASLGLAEAGRRPPDLLHIFVLDFGAGALAPLGRLPHTGAYIGPGDRERQARLIRMLRRELDRRKSAPARASVPAPGTGKPGGATAPPDWLVLIDGVGSLSTEYGKDAAGVQLFDSLSRVYAEGPAIGIRVVGVADRYGAVPGPWAATTQQKLALRLADTSEYAMFDVPREAVPSAVPGRAVVCATRQIVQIAWHGGDLTGAAEQVAARTVAAWPSARATAPAVELLPRRVTAAELRARGAQAALTGEPAVLPIGLGDEELAPVALVLYENEHALIAGPPRSGRSTALRALATLAAAGPEPCAVVALAGRRSPLRAHPGLDAVLDGLGELDRLLSGFDDRPVLLLVDDAEGIDDTAGVLRRWMKAPHGNVHVVAAGRAESVRRAYGHWTGQVRESRCGVLLTPDYDLDGDLLGATLPRLDRLAALPGRGFAVVGGSVQGVQVAVPE